MKQKWIAICMVCCMLTSIWSETIGTNVANATDGVSKDVYETVYTDDFEDEAEGSNPSHWLEEGSADQWRIYNYSGNLVYGTTSTDYSYTWLHTFEENPTISMEFLVEDEPETGRIEFLTRFAEETYAYAGIGYDFSELKWYIYTRQGIDFEARILYADDTCEFEADKWNEICIVEEGSSIQVSLNDEIVIEDTEAAMTGYGRIGVLTEGVSLCVDNLSYTMPNGGQVDDGIREFVFDYDTYGGGNFMELESLGNGTLIGTSGSKRYLSTDAGLTWSETTAYSAFKGKGLGYTSVLQLDDEEFLMVYGDTFTVWRSDDNMQTWKQVGQILSADEDNLTDDGQWERIIHVNSLTRVKLSAEKERIFLPVGVRRFTSAGNIRGHYAEVYYSDDEGVTWQKSENDTRSVIPNYSDDLSVYHSWAEAKIISCSDGTLRMYNSREYDCIVYTESYDNGETWTGVQSIPYLQNGQTSFGIAEDPSEPGTYYMACLNNVASSYNYTLPRNRISLVKSTDGKNWEYVMDLERFSSCDYGSSSEIYQILDPSIVIADGYLYITMGRSYAYQENNAHHQQVVLLIRAEIEKLSETRAWDATNLADTSRPEKLEWNVAPTQTYEVGDEFSTEGASVKVTAFDGTVSYQDISAFDMVGDGPDMSVDGVYTVQFMNLYAQYVSCDVQVEDKVCMLFTEDFAGDESEMATVGWNAEALQYFSLLTEAGTDSTKLVSNYESSDDGTETVCEGMALCLDDNEIAAQWSDYTIRAKVTLTDTGVSSTDVATGKRVGILAAVDPENDSWYEFRLIYNITEGIPYQWQLMKRTNGVNAVVAYGGFSFSFGQCYQLMMRLEGNALSCYIDGTLKCEYEQTETLCGTIGLQATANVCEFDSIRVFSNKDVEQQCYDVSFYRQGIKDEDEVCVYIHPYKEGKVFGGWYTDVSCKTPMSATNVSGEGYAKWVDKQVLTVKGQITAGTTILSDQTNLRLLTTVDSLDYQYIGFDVMRTDTNAKKRVFSSTVYDTVLALNDKEQFVSYKPDTVFADESAYFMVCTFTGIPRDDFDTPLQISPFWVTADGTTVTGVMRGLQVSEGLEAVADSLTDGGTTENGNETGWEW